MKILVTAGATREPVDAVRFLSNASTGATGAALADAFTAAGHEVVLLSGEGSVKPARRCDVEVFSSAGDLAERLRRRLGGGEIDAVVMAAAVADYRPAAAVAGKISSDADELVLRLVRNEKILPRLKSVSPRPVFVVGFKLTVDAAEAARREAVASQFAAGGVDAVVHNDLAEIQATPAERHPFSLYRAAHAAPEKLAGAGALADALAALLAGAGVRR
ncbi:MAG TPA: phosphopantothenoylcysteine decarboxylase [Opitutus sp.]|nr:phosphopantothenoylcysteine decarboxylase [Opitutus sp.]